jgi:hypothetical protein
VLVVPGIPDSRHWVWPSSSSRMVRVGEIEGTRVVVMVGKIGTTGVAAADVKILVEGAIVAAQAMEEEAQL